MLKKPTNTQYIAAAKLQQIDGELEIDVDTAKVSKARGEIGVYVAAWIWVYDADVRFMLKESKLKPKGGPQWLKQARN